MASFLYIQHWKSYTKSETKPSQAPELEPCQIKKPSGKKQAKFLYLWQKKIGSPRQRGLGLVEESLEKIEKNLPGTGKMEKIVEPKSQPMMIISYNSQ